MEERAGVLDDLAELEVFRTLLEPTGIKGIVVDCPDCDEEHHVDWALMQANLRQLLDEGQTGRHEPPFDPDPDDYVSWDYASGYADGVAAHRRAGRAERPARRRPPRPRGLSAGFSAGRRTGRSPGCRRLVVDPDEGLDAHDRGEPLDAHAQEGHGLLLAGVRAEGGELAVGERGDVHPGRDLVVRQADLGGTRPARRLVSPCPCRLRAPSPRTSPCVECGHRRPVDLRRRPGPLQRGHGDPVGLDVVGVPVEAVRVVGHDDVRLVLLDQLGQPGRGLLDGRRPERPRRVVGRPAGHSGVGVAEQLQVGRPRGSRSSPRAPPAARPRPPPDRVPARPASPRPGRRRSGRRCR